MRVVFCIFINISTPINKLKQQQNEFNISLSDSVSKLVLVIGYWTTKSINTCRSETNRFLQTEICMCSYMFYFTFSSKYKQKILFQWSILSSKCKLLKEKKEEKRTCDVLIDAWLYNVYYFTSLQSQHQLLQP